MKVILQEKVANLGAVGAQVNVKPGYARNYLLPTGKAVMATPANVADFEQRRAEFEKRAAEILAKAQKRAQQLNEVQVKIAAQAGDEGKLFGSIGPRDIASAIAAQGHEIHKSEILMPQGPIRHVGDYDVNVQLHSEVDFTIKVSVIAE